MNAQTARQLAGEALYPDSEASVIKTTISDK